jgi:MSHA biogenesis protein MshP
VKSRFHRLKGVAAIVALFLLVVLAALGAFMLSFSNTQQLSSARDVQGSRAYWAARAGLEWALAAVDVTAPVAPAVAPLATCPAVAQPATIDGFTLQPIACERRLYDEGGGAVPRVVFRLTATVNSTGAVGSVGYIERSVSASVEY